MTYQKIKGVTLLEVLLVLAIASSLLVMMLNFTTQKSDELRRDKTVLQIQQILNAGMSYYVNKSSWPLAGGVACGSNTWTDISALQPNYIPSTLSNNSYARTFSIGCNIAANGGGFFVETQVDNATNAAIIAGRLPLAYRTTSYGGSIPPASCTSGNNCTVVVANVNIPGQNLNNARSVNFASVYYSGSCVPAPVCPPNMKANILVMPAAITGSNDGFQSCTTYLSPPSCPWYNPWCTQTPYQVCTPTPPNTYPVHSFTVYARGGSSGNGAPTDPNGSGSGPPLNCDGTASVPCVKDSGGGTITSDGTLYWRVCLNVSTSKGTVTPTNQTEGQAMGSIVAMTRCVPNNGSETPSGSIDVWQQ